MVNIQNKKGITLIVLVVTIVILLILAGTAIAMLVGENGLVKKASQAKDDNNKQTATEIINLKITNSQMKSYAKKERLPTLQEIADDLCEDNEIQYVTTKTQISSLDKITVGNASSIFTKLNEFPYEFEINSSLQLASIDGVKISDVNSDTIVISKDEYNNLKSKIDELYTNYTSIGTLYKTEKLLATSSNASTETTLLSITVPKGTYVANSYLVDTVTGNTEVVNIILLLQLILIMVV